MKILNYIKTTRFRTTLWYASIFLLLEIVIGLIVYFYLETSMAKQLDISLYKQVDMISHFVSKSEIDLSEFKADSIYSEPDELVYDIIFEAIAYNPTNTFIQVRYKDKVVFKSANLVQTEINISSHKENQIELVTFYDSLLSEHPIRAAYLDKNGYSIIAAFPIELNNNTLKSLTDIYIIIAPIFLLLSLAGGALISFSALSRIDKIIKKTDEITTHNLNEIILGENHNDEYGRLVTTMNKMVKRLKTSIDFINQFSISAAHELKTPLTILRGEIELALKSDKTPADYKEVLKSNYEETLRLINIVEHLFYISKLDNSLIRLNKIEINIENFIDSVIKSFKKIKDEKKLKIILETEANLKIIADPEMFKQVIINLVDNAIKYANENTNILIKCGVNDQEKIYLSISNLSEEISQENLDRLFDRFYRTESSRNRDLGGAGLGLSIVKSIVDFHDWNIKVKYTQENMIIFTIII